MADVEVRPVPVPVEDLHTDPSNPRRITEREMDRLKRSLTDDPDFMRLRPILARPDGTIYAGNQRFEAAKALGWTTVPAILTDDPEDLLKKRAVRDNTQFGEWVLEDLGEYLSTIEDPDLDIASLGLDDRTLGELGLDTDMPDMPDFPRPLAEEAAGGGTGAAGMQRPAYDADDPSSATLENAPGKLEGILQLDEHVAWPGSNYWDIPRLREDMLVDRLPEPLMCWSDQKTTPPREDMHYLWNWGLAPSTGLPMDRTLLCFYTHDYHFENWWGLPAFYTAKVLNAGIRMAVVPDFSLYGDLPRTLNLLNVYRAQWMGRFFQEAGIKVIPRLNWAGEGSYDWCFEGIPKEPPVAAICLQTFLPAGKKKGEDDSEDTAKAMAYIDEGLRKAIEVVQPQSLLNYGGNPAHRIVKEMNLGIPVMHVQNYSYVRRGVAFDKGAPHTDSAGEVPNKNLTDPGAFLEMP